MTNLSEPNFSRRFSDLQHEHISDLTQLKVIQKQHAEELKGLSLTLGNLSDQFKQVKWTVFGGVGFYVLQTVGFIEFIKGIL